MQSTSSDLLPVLLARVVVFALQAGGHVNCTAGFVSDSTAGRTGEAA